MCKGAKATLVIPPLLGYGDRGAGGGLIPGGATLRFEVEVVNVAENDGLPEDEHEPDLFSFLDEDGDGKLSYVLSQAVLLIFQPIPCPLPHTFFPIFCKLLHRVAELTEYFQMQGSALPEGLMEREDKDGDGFISWEEFSGPKGEHPPTPAPTNDERDEL